MNASHVNSQMGSHVATVHSLVLVAERQSAAFGIGAST